MTPAEKRYRNAHGALLHTFDPTPAQEQEFEQAEAALKAEYAAQRWLVGSTARNIHTGQEFLITQVYGDDDKYFLEGRGWVSREHLNEHFIMARVANWPPQAESERTT